MKNISIQTNKLGTLTTVAEDILTVQDAIELATKLVKGKKAFIFEDFKLVEVVSNR